MSESPKTSHEEEAGGGEGRAERAGYPEAGTSPAESRLGYPQAGYRAPMPPSSPWPTPSGYGDGYDPSGWRWNNAAPDAGGWVWDEASGGWRWGQAGPGWGGWGWDDSSGGWRWDQAASGSGGSGWGDPPAGSGGWAGGNGYPGQPGEWGSGPWDYSRVGWQRPPSRRGAHVVTALLAAALIAAIVGAGLANGAWRSATTPHAVSPPASGGSPSGGSSSQPSFGQPGAVPANPQPSSGGSPVGGSSGAGGSSSNGAGGGNLKATPAQIEAVGKQVAPALVDINTTISYSQEQAAGTGIVLTSNGEILTNNHVINGATSLQVTDVGNGKAYNAKVVGYDHSQDIAVLQLVGASGLAKATIGDSSGVATGQSVIAIGNAGGAGGQPSITGGSITSLNQSITASDEGDGSAEQLSDLIQSNVAIQPGDSGGSLVDLSGHVVGVNTAASDGFSLQTGGRSTQGFSIPINRAISIVREIEAGQASPSVHVGATAFLGVRVSTAGQGSASSGSGATISVVIANGAAASAGLVAGDTITAFGGRTVSSSSDLTNILEIYHPGQSAPVVYVDSGGQRHTVNVTLASGPPT